MRFIPPNSRNTSVLIVLLLIFLGIGALFFLRKDIQETQQPTVSEQDGVQRSDGIVQPPEVTPGVYQETPLQKVEISETEEKEPLSVSSLWHRVSGNPAEDCSNHIFEGKVSIHGWYEWRTDYVDKKWLLVVNKSDETKLISGFKGSLAFNLKGSTPQLDKLLKKATAEKPIALTVKKLGYYCEGMPWLEL